MHVYIPAVLPGLAEQILCRGGKANQNTAAASPSPSYGMQCCSGKKTAVAVAVHAIPSGEREVESICTHPRIHYNPIYYAVSHSPASYLTFDGEGEERLHLSSPSERNLGRPLSLFHPEHLEIN